MRYTNTQSYNYSSLEQKLINKIKTKKKVLRVVNYNRINSIMQSREMNV